MLIPQIIGSGWHSPDESFRSNQICKSFHFNSQKSISDFILGLLTYNQSLLHISAVELHITNIVAVSITGILDNTISFEKEALAPINFVEALYRKCNGK